MERSTESIGMTLDLPPLRCGRVSVSCSKSIFSQASLGLSISDSLAPVNRYVIMNGYQRLPFGQTRNSRSSSSGVSGRGPLSSVLNISTARKGFLKINSRLMAQLKRALRCLSSTLIPPGLRPCFWHLRINLSTVLALMESSLGLPSRARWKALTAERVRLMVRGDLRCRFRSESSDLAFSYSSAKSPSVPIKACRISVGSDSFPSCWRSANSR